MKCSYCGKNNKEGALICKRCGMGLPVTPPDPEGRALFDGEFTPPQDTEATGIENPGPAAEKRSGLKKALVAACCAILVILVLIAIISIAGSGNVISSSSVPYVIGTDAVIKSGQFVNPSADAMISAKTNIDGTKVGILTGAGDLFYEPNGGDKAVARNVVSFSVSVDGKYLTYRDENGLLWSFDSAKTESAPVCICNEFVKDGYVTSPDGKSVLFRKFDDLKLYLWSGGKTQVVGEEGMTPISVSNGGKHIYAYSDSEGLLYYVPKRGRASALKGDIAQNIYLNSTHTQVLFSCNAGDGTIVTMLSNAGAEPVEILSADYAVSPVVTSSGICMSDLGGNFDVVTCPFKSFDGIFFAGECILRYSLRNGVSILEPLGCSGAVANDNYSTVLYTLDGTLSKRPTGGASNPERLASDCGSFRISSNGSVIWYLDSEYALHCLKGNSDVLIARKVSEFSVMPNGRDAIFISAGRLCCNQNGNAKRSFVFDGVNAREISCDSKGLYYYSLADGWVKLGSGGRRADLSK